MKKYEVTLFIMGLPFSENNTRVVEIDAESQDEAEKKAHDWYISDGWGVYSSKEVKTPKRYAVKVHYETFCYREVEATSREEAYEKACHEIDGTSDDAYREEIIRNLYNVDDPEITEI